MCGIAGIIQTNKSKDLLGMVKKMTYVISHRGPDGEGIWISEENNICFGHRRLSIIDLSQEANQPMHYNQRYTIVFNGEIYNYLELKNNLLQEGFTFNTASDTEVLLALYDKYKSNCLQFLDGMFAFAIYDKIENKIFIARDRFGEKPFFYSYKKNEYFYFGSEIKCLWEVGIEKKVNDRMMFNYLTFGYIDNPKDLSETFYENCTRLPHSHFINIDLDKLEIQINKYYDIDWKKINKTITLNEAKITFKKLFETSVSRRLRSDVAVGSSLSGGLDSSLVVTTIDKIKTNQNQIQKTFSAIFPGFKRDESKYINYVLKNVIAEPHFVTPTDLEMISDFEKLKWHQEEPFGSASIYIQYRVMKLCKDNNVTVLLDGQGADEYLAGYHHYYTSFFNELKLNSYNTYKKQYEEYLKIHLNNEINGITKQSFGNKIRKISPFLILPLKRMRASLQHFFKPVLNNNFYKKYRNQIYKTNGFECDSLNQALYNSMLGTGGLQQLLRYADRNSMAHSREIRLPFLNHELVEFIFSLPAEMKINLGWTKWIMRETFEILPEEIAWRKDKIGFEPPQQNWMQNSILKKKIEETKELLIQKSYLQKGIKLDEQNAETNWRILNCDIF